MQLEDTSPINTSTKSKFRFARDVRFKPIKLTHHQVGFMQMTKFDKSVLHR